jgi:hypothetical protein
MRKKRTDEECQLLAQHLTELGCPLDPIEGYADAPAGLKIVQSPDPATNVVFDLECGTGFMLDVRISSDLNLPIRIRRVGIKASWGPLDISLLPDPSKSRKGYECYDFPGTQFGFHQSVVANDFFSGERSLNPGGQVSGLLLATDKSEIPPGLSGNGRITVEVDLFDERGNIFKSEFRLRMERTLVYSLGRIQEAAPSRQPKSSGKRFIDAA